MDGSTTVFILVLVCIFVFTVQRRNAKQAPTPTRTVKDTAPTPTVLATEESSSPEPLPEAHAAQRVNRKRPVNKDMVEIVMTMAPHVQQQKVVQDLRATGSIERTMENIFAGKLD
ncbi:hypothetical protein GRS66_009708 [Saccharomyces pastorianus]|nr:hypothetical protein GRS66_009708 [Saccharomyces pastorianus]